MCDKVSYNFILQIARVIFIIIIIYTQFVITELIKKKNKNN